MGDADQSYGFSEVDRFVKKFREGFELVMGCRLPNGGGRIMPGAMPFSHRWLLILSPKMLFLAPGFFLVLLGLTGYALALPGLKIGGITFDAHTLLFSSLAILMGYQSFLFALCAKTFAINEGLLPRDPRIDWFFKIMYLERGLAIGSLAFVAGLILLGVVVLQWKSVDFGHLDYAVTMRWAIPGATLTSLGFQTILSSFFVSVLGMKRRL